MPRLKSILAALISLVVSVSPVTAEDDFDRQIKPFITTYCIECHNAKTAEGALDLTRYKSSGAVGEEFRQWEHIVTFVKKGDMPPSKAKQPTADERAAVLKTIEGVLAAEAKKVAGDPGTVLPRRLSNAEYNYTIRDLTGVDIRPADSFPVDPASGEGFNNTGEALVISPSLFKKYYAVAQQTADHVLLTPTGMKFAPFPVVTFADRVKFYEQAIIRFYEEHDVDYEEYLTATWSYRHRSSERRAETVEQWAIANQLSPKYLRTVWDLLNVPPTDEQLFLGTLRKRWQALPSPINAPAGATSATVPPEVTKSIAALAQEIQRTSKLLCAKETAAIVSNAGNAPIQHIERRKKTADERDVFNPDYLAEHRRLHVEYKKLAERSEIKIYLRAAVQSTDGRPAYVILRKPTFSPQSVSEYRPTPEKKPLALREVLLKHAPEQWQKLQPGKHPLGHAIAEDEIVLSTATPLEITVPTAAFGKRQEIRFFVEAELDRKHSPTGFVQLSAAEKENAGTDPLNRVIDASSPLAEQQRAANVEFCRVFPNRFVYVDDTRGLSAGFHLIEGMFRDDQPLCKLVLNDEQNRELNRLWDELYFGTGVVEKMLRGFVFFERSEHGFLKHPDFDQFKEEDPELVKDATLAQFEQAFLTRSGVKPDDPKLGENPIHLFFADIRAGLKRREAQWAEAKPIYWQQLQSFAERAYRRPLTAAELTKLEQFYEQTCRQPEFGVELAVRGVVTSLLVSPHFCCRIDVPPEGESVQPMNDLALASRLSYLLWSSMPDDELLTLAKAGKLNDETTLRQQTRRMLRDAKVGGFALEFFGQWLRYRDFLTAESVDRRVFPSFNDELKQAMFEEPTRLITHLMQNDLPVTDVLFGETTFVNAPLADHYGWPIPTGGEWRQVDGLHEHGRGGVLGMAVFLTTNSQPQRTSPVKRGFWVVHKILGEHIPAPPADVAVLPAKETEANQTVRRLLAAHTEVETCARCHRRFDPVGLAMEGFDPIGKSRVQDLAGRPIDDVVQLPTGGTARGVPEFVKYLQSARRDDFIKTLCHKFLGYALGRSVELSDQELLEKLYADLKRDDDRFGTLFETVICSPQFRNQRGRDFSFTRFRAESSGD